ncbi:PfkB family carbohydrate kinase [Actinoplanes sp. NPDC051411]|uniref:1-phosphofructokinase family hexose kinase n=1 Tax=Actinoplanes sp. NPDC051411 TaxID=3155522 RepID=UPI00343155D1
MILAVCLNPAVDVTYVVDAVRPGASHKVSTVHRRPGGKGVNVARVLAQLGEPVTLCGFAGGATGRWLRSALADSALADSALAGSALADSALAGSARAGSAPADSATVDSATAGSARAVSAPAGSGVIDRLTEVEADTRQTVTVVDDADASVFNEPGPTLTDRDWARFTETYDELLKDCEVAVMSGSVPPGAPADAYAFLVRRAQHHKIATVVDAADAQLQSAIDAGPTILAPNRAEIGLPGAGPAELLAAASRLSRRTGGTVVISAGSDGLVASDGLRSWTARPPRHVTGNPTGAGDALTAALARGLARHLPRPTALADALALAAAAVAAPVAGQIDEPLYRELTASSTVQEVAPCP